MVSLGLTPIITFCFLFQTIKTQLLLIIQNATNNTSTQIQYYLSETITELITLLFIDNKEVPDQNKKIYALSLVSALETEIKSPHAKKKM